MFSPDKWFGAEGSFYNGVATQSLRFNGSSSYLSRTPSSAGSSRKFAISCWVKRSNLGLQGVYEAKQVKDDQSALVFETANTLIFTDRPSNVRNIDLRTNRVFRDVGAWYHIVIAVDTTQGTDSNRVLMYINGQRETSFSTEDYPTQNYDVAYWNNTQAHRIGSSTGNTTNFFDGYIAEFNFVDDASFFSDTSGTANTSFNIDSFGTTKNGVWVPKRYSGSYGTNGFRLAYKSTDLNVSGGAVSDPRGSGTDLPDNSIADASGQGNHFAISSVGAEDFLEDSPENNWCTLSAIAKSAGLTISEGALQTNNANDFALGTLGVTSGKWYWENYINSTNGGFAGAYEADVGDFATTVDDGGNNPSGYGYYNNGSKVRDNTYTSYGATFQTAGDIIGVALDMDNGAIYFSKNGTWQNSATTSEIAAGTTTNAAYTGISGTIVPRVGHYNNNNPTVVNFGQDPTFAGSITAGTATPSEGAGVFKYAPPTGFLALCSANISEPTIGPTSDTQADDYFDILTYTGNSANDSSGSTQSITGLDFQPDWIWTKNRDTASDHRTVDSTRGVQKTLYISDTRVENGLSDGTDGITSFGAGGFAVGQHTGFNKDGDNFVAWCWKINGGSTASTTATGTTAATTMQRNTTAGISMVKYVGTGVANSGSASDHGDQTLAHGLQIGSTATKPDMMIIKSTDYAGGWATWHKDMGGDLNSDFLILDTNAGRASTSNKIWGSAGGPTGTGSAPTTTVFTVGMDWNVNRGPNSLGAGNTANNYVGWFMASVEGFSKFGKYIGNGNADGTFVYLGFRPSFFLHKRVNSSENWHIIDTVRDPFNKVGNVLFPDITDDEAHYTSEQYDILSNGIKLRNTGASKNGDDDVYIYMAFAETPFKYANAR